MDELLREAVMCVQEGLLRVLTLVLHRRDTLGERIVLVGRSEAQWGSWSD